MKRLIAFMLCLVLCMSISTTTLAKDDTSNFVIRDEKKTYDFKTETLFETITFTENGIDGTLTSVWQKSGKRVITLEYDKEVQTFTSNNPQPAVSMNNGTLRVTYPYESPYYYTGEEIFTEFFVNLTKAALAAFLSNEIGAPLAVGLSIVASVLVDALIGESVTTALYVRRWWKVYMPNSDPASHIFTTKIGTTVYYIIDGDLVGTGGPSTQTFQSYGGPYI